MSTRRMSKRESTTQKMFFEIPLEIREKYNMSTKETHISIHSPAYINIENPTLLEVNEITIRIYSKKIITTLWRENIIMHTTVF